MLAAIEQRLTALRVDDKVCFPFVGSAMNVATAMASGLIRPLELYVVPLPGNYQRASQDLGPLSQQGVEAFAVVMGVKAYNDAKGQSGNRQLDELKRQIISALLGWQPTTTAERIELTGTEPLGLKRDAFWYACRFRVPVYLQQEQP